MIAGESSNLLSLTSFPYLAIYSDLSYATYASLAGGGHLYSYHKCGLFPSLHPGRFLTINLILPLAYIFVIIVILDICIAVLIPYSTEKRDPTQMKSTSTKIKCTWPMHKFCVGLYSTDSWGFALRETQILCFVLGVRQI